MSESIAERVAQTRDIRLGIAGARSCWHILSLRQREALEYAEIAGGRVELRAAFGLQPFYIAPRARVKEARYPLAPTRKPTMRKLCALGLMAWDGGALDPELAAVITERGLFVLRHGPAENNEAGR